MNDLLKSLEKRSSIFWIIVGLILIAAVGVVDYLTGYEVSFSLFYLFPISLLAWYSGRGYGIAASILSASVWYLAEITAGQTYSHPVIHIWNSFVRFGFFIIVTLLLTNLRMILRQEEELSSIDYLTGAVNARAFSKLLQSEIDRSNRYKLPLP